MNALRDRDCRAGFDRYFRVHPLVRYHAELRGPGTHRDPFLRPACYPKSAA